VVVERVAADDPAIQCTWAKGPGLRVTLRIRIDQTRLSSAVLRSNVQVHLSGPAPQDVTVPVTCTLH
jgi:hypothetical protein